MDFSIIFGVQCINSHPANPKEQGTRFTKSKEIQSRNFCRLKHIEIGFEKGNHLSPGSSSQKEIIEPLGKEEKGAMTS